MNDNSYFSIWISKSFYKVDENLKILDDQTFEIRGIDSDLKIDGLGIVTMYDGMYTVTMNGNVEYSYIDMKHVLPKVLVDRLEQVETKDDALALGEEMGVDFYSQYKIETTIPLKIKQTTTQEGFVTNDLIYFVEGSIRFNYQDDSYTLSHINVYLDGLSNYNMMKLEDFEGINSLSDFSKYEYGTFDELQGEGTCMNQSGADGKIISDTLNNPCQTSISEGSWSYDLVHYFIDYQGEAKLEIENTVNGSAEYNAKNNKELNYEITVKNSGDVSSWNNVITTSIPEEIIVNEDSISDDGDYDKSDDSITWKIDELEAGEKYTLSYSATVSDKADKSKTYVGKTKVFSNQSEVVHAKDTKVYLSNASELIDRNNLVNPNTYSTAVFGIVTVILVCLVIGTYFVKKKESLK